MVAIRGLRKEQGLTQSDIAKQLGCTPNAVSMWETGDRNPSLDNVVRLAEILHCTTDEILKSKSEQESTTFEESVKRKEE